MAWLGGGARVRAAGVRIICDPPTATSGLYSHPALICHSLCGDDWRGAEEQDNYDIMTGWLSSSRSWSDTEDRNGQHFPQESNPPHTTICCLFSRRALHSGGGRICTSKGLDGSWNLSKCLHYNWLKFWLNHPCEMSHNLCTDFIIISKFSHRVFPKPEPAHTETLTTIMFKKYYTCQVFFENMLATTSNFVSTTFDEIFLSEAKLWPQPYNSGKGMLFTIVVFYIGEYFQFQPWHLLR